VFQVLHAGKCSLYIGGVVLCRGGNGEGKTKDEEVESKTHENPPSESDALTIPREDAQAIADPHKTKRPPHAGAVRTTLKKLRLLAR
jgi:hypothetical protein